MTNLILSNLTAAKIHEVVDTCRLYITDLCDDIPDLNVDMTITTSGDVIIDPVAPPDWDPAYQDITEFNFASRFVNIGFDCRSKPMAGVRLAMTDLTRPDLIAVIQQRALVI